MSDINNTMTDSLLDDEEQQLYEHFRIVADAGQVPLRVDKFMAEHLPHSSRNRIQKAADNGFVHANDRAVKSNYKVRPGDVITLMLDRPQNDSTIYPEDIPLDIVYEDPELMVVNKPAGMVVHPGCGNFSGTLINAVAWHLRDDKNFDANNPEVGLVHRIDKDTSGLLVVAKTAEAKSELGLQFFNKTTHRSYLALVWANFVEDEGRIEGNIGRDPKDRLRMAVFPPDSDIGKPAVTHYKVMHTGNRQDPPDTRPHEAHRTSDVCRRTLRRNGNTQRRTHKLIQGIHQQLLQAVSATGPARTDTRLRTPEDTQADGLLSACARRHAGADREMEKPESQLEI